MADRFLGRYLFSCQGRREAAKLREESLASHRQPPADGFENQTGNATSEAVDSPSRAH
ncbi:MAG: hypothetical protein ACLQVM_15770 [Terriglobia bacterium]